MTYPARFLSAFGSAVANVSLLTGILSAWPQLARSHVTSPGRGEPPRIHALAGWEPFVDDPGSAAPLEDKPECPWGREPAPLVHLVHAPLPAGFDPFVAPGGPLYACVLVAVDGWVLGAGLAAGSAGAGMDRRLINIIRTRWRFVPAAGPRAASTWHRVRLSAGVPG